MKKAKKGQAHESRKPEELLSFLDKKPSAKILITPPKLVCDASFENSYDSVKFGKKLTIKSDLTAASSVRPKTAVNYMKF